MTRAHRHERADRRLSVTRNAEVRTAVIASLRLSERCGTLEMWRRARWGNGSRRIVAVAV